MSYYIVLHYLMLGIRRLILDNTASKVRRCVQVRAGACRCVQVRAGACRCVLMRRASFSKMGSLVQTEKNKLFCQSYKTTYSTFVAK